MAINYPVSELADRCTIARLKYERIDSPERLTFLEEMDLYHKELESYEDINSFLKRLYEVNGLIWDQEAEIRAGQTSNMTLEEVGKRALKIRDLNRKRVGIKGEIVDHYGEGFKDMKCNYSGEDDEE